MKLSVIARAMYYWEYRRMEKVYSGSIECLPATPTREVGAIMSDPNLYY